MWYQPKFCSECGEKIARAEWKFWHSRQFCDLCSTKHQVFDATGRFSLLLVPIILIGFAASAFMPGKMSNQLKSTAPPAKSFVSDKKLKDVEPKAVFSQQPSVLQEQQKQGILAASREQEISGGNRQTEEIYFCGAPTKKGTPCTRRVKVKGLCWQHKQTVP